MIYTTFGKKGRPSFEIVGDHGIATATMEEVAASIERTKSRLPRLSAWLLRRTMADEATHEVKRGTAALHKLLIRDGNRELLSHDATAERPVTINSDGLATRISRMGQTPISRKISVDMHPYYVAAAAMIGADRVADQYELLFDSAGIPAIRSEDVHYSVGIEDAGSYRPLATLLHPDYYAQTRVSQGE